MASFLNIEIPPKNGYTCGRFDHISTNLWSNSPVRRASLEKSVKKSSSPSRLAEYWKNNEKTADVRG
jgi:hypothetical protein